MRRQLFEAEKEARWTVLQKHGLVEVENDSSAVAGDSGKDATPPSGAEQNEEVAVTLTPTGLSEYYPFIRGKKTQFDSVLVPRGTRAEHRQARNPGTRFESKILETFYSNAKQRSKKPWNRVPVVISTAREEAALKDLEIETTERQRRVINAFLFNTLRVIQLEELVEAYWDTCVLGVLTIFGVLIDSRVANDEDYG
ncbi:unnamed protein product, partial [Amoebophrya sp. A25]